MSNDVAPAAEESADRAEALIAGLLAESPVFAPGTVDALCAAHPYREPQIRE